MTKTRQYRAPEPTTFSRFATSDADTLIGGRFSVTDQNKVIVGSTAQPDYPPAAAHQTDPTGIEPPISFQDAVEPVGTHQEIAASLGDACDGAPSAQEHASGEARSAVHHALQRPRRPSSKRKG